MAEKLTAILVDDEESARDVLANLLKRFCPSIEIVGKYANLPKAVQGVKDYGPDIVFLDIEMPNFAGYEIMRFFDHIDFEIIFVTAYESYAVKAFQIAAADYLLKPVDIERLKGAVERVRARISSKTATNQYQILKESLQSEKINHLVIAGSGQHDIVPIKDIIAIEAHESYSKIHLENHTYTASKNLKHFESMLADNQDFFRSHKSWIINLKKLVAYNKTKNEIQLSNTLFAKLSRYRKVEFEARL